MAGEIGMGAFGNAVTGAAAGAPLGPWGMAAGALVGGIAGIGQGKRAQKLEKDYLAAERNVNPVDPNEVAYLNKVRQQERAFRAGSDPSSAFAAMNARNVGAQTMSNINRAGGPGVVGNLLRAQAGTNQAIAGIGANAAAGANQMLNMQGGLVSRMADKVYQRQVELRNQALERSVSARQNLQNTFQGALAMVPGIAGGIGKMGGGNMSVGKSQMRPNTSAVENFDWTQARSQSPIDQIVQTAIPAAGNRIPAGYGQFPSPMNPVYPSPQYPGAGDRMLAYGNPSFMQPRPIF